MSGLEEQIRDLRDQGMPLKEIASRTDVSYPRVWRIVNAEKARRQGLEQERRKRERAKQMLARRKVGQTLPWEGVA